MPDRTPLLLRTLERLLEASGTELQSALTQASNLVAEALAADKVDVFLYAPERDSLVALGSSLQPLSALQKKHGLDVLSVSNGGRVVQAFERAEAFLSGRIDADVEELRGIREVLGIRSLVAAPFHVGEQRRGVVAAASRTPEFWSDQDLVFLQSVTRWIGVVAHRAELSAESARNAVEQGRRAAADELIAVLAHDLRNHLAPLDLRLRSLRRRAERDERDDDLRDLGLALAGFQRFQTLINDLLDAARVDQGLFVLDASPLPLLALLEETAAALETPDHPVLVEATCEPIVLADPTRLRQCLENLIGNAIKHSPKQAKVRVVMASVQRENGPGVAVEVIDQGAGIPEELLPRIFERYVKGKRSGGLGLGLYLAKRIVDMHRGEISVASQPGMGTRFRVTLPCYAGQLGSEPRVRANTWPNVQ